MNALDFQASINNLTQLDKVQQEQHRAPVVNQTQNAAAAAEEAAQRVVRPEQPDQVEGKVIDPNARRQERQAKRRRNRELRKNRPDPDSPTRTGHFVDLDA